MLASVFYFSVLKHIVYTNIFTYLLLISVCSVAHISITKWTHHVGPFVLWSLAQHIVAWSSTSCFDFLFPTEKSSFLFSSNTSVLTPTHVPDPISVAFDLIYRGLTIKPRPIGRLRCSASHHAPFINLCLNPPSYPPSCQASIDLPLTPSLCTRPLKTTTQCLQWVNTKMIPDKTKQRHDNQIVSMILALLQQFLSLS